MFHNKKSFIYIIAKHGIILIAAIFIGTFLLFLSGLLPQKQIAKHIRESLYQLETDEAYPHITDDKRWSDMIDTYSEDMMLICTYFMDTKGAPDTCLTNPKYEYTDKGGESSTYQALDLIFKSEESVEPTEYYSRYWMGFRVYFRILLLFFTYPQMRRIHMSILLLLFVLSIVKLYKTTAKQHYAVLLGITFILLNPFVLMTSFHASICFVIALLGILLLPKYGDGFFTYPTYFFMLGIVTQYFDFYTAPILTYGIPFTAMLLANENEIIKTKEKLLLFAKTFLCWMSAYVLMWIGKMAITSLFTPIDSLKDGFTRLFEWLSIGSAGERVVQQYGYEVNPLKALARVFSKIIFDDFYATALVLVFIILAWMIKFLVQKDKIQRLKKNAVYLIVCVLPLIWFCISSSATIIHARFQYRSLGTLIFALGIFLINTVSSKQNQTLNSVKKP